MLLFVVVVVVVVCLFLLFVVVVVVFSPFLLVAHIRDEEFCSFINHYVSYSGFTPLHYAILCDDVKLVKYLLDQGADPTVENNRGYTPSDYCTNEEIKAILEDAAIKVFCE